MNKKAVADSHFLKEYVKQANKVILSTYPGLPKNKVKEIVIKMVEKDLMNPPVVAKNSYTKEAQNTTLLSALDYVMERKPIIAANATFFKQHSESINPNANMLIEFGDLRSHHKKLMFKAEQERNISAYNIEDIDQTNYKKLSNSWYGGSLLPSAAFFNRECGAATTKTARSVISTCMTTFEAVLADTFTFVDLQDFFTWTDAVLSEKVELDDWVVRKNVDDVYERLAYRIIKKESRDDSIVYSFLSQKTEEELTRLYWKYNLLEFTKAHQYIQDIYRLIYRSIGAYKPMKDDNDFSVVPDEFMDKVKGSGSPADTWKKILEFELFYNPNKAPDSIKDTLEILSNTLIKYIYVEFAFTDRMYKLKNFRRNVVTTIDTDSNILSLDPWIEYCFDELMESDYGREYMDNVFININTITYVISQVISITLDYYGRCSNVAEDQRWRYQMKNEYFFSKLILAPVKKRYLNKMILREGNKLTKPKYDIKGYDFKKASTSDDTSEFYMGIVKNELLDKDDIDVVKILELLRGFRKEIRKSISSGETKYLPLESPKELEAYANPNREQSVRALFAWNTLYPHDQIALPAKISVLKTKIYSMDVIKDLKTTHPDMYDKIADKIFNDKTGMFVKMTSEKEKVEGLSVIAIPPDGTIPEWIIPYIDYMTVINDVLAPFKSVTETFGIPNMQEGPTERRSVGFSNIVRL